MAKAYRVYMVDGSGHIVKGHDVEADTDDEACDKACDLTLTGAVEVWEGTRLVFVRLPPKAPQS
jgi:hypothetical protein